MSLEKKILPEIHEDFNVYSKSVDDDNTRYDYKSLRGNGGIAIFWRKSFDSAIDITPDGNNRIQAITINSSPMTCIINVYLPSEIKEGDLEYRETLDQLQEVILKYGELYNIILCGDMNASLHRDERRRDTLFKNFNINNELYLAPNHPQQATFYHHNGKHSSQIDYILFNNQASEELEPQVTIKPMHPMNTSDHTLIQAELNLEIKHSTRKHAKILSKPKWEKCDQDTYKLIVKEGIRQLQNDKPKTVSNRIEKLEKILHKAGKCAIPKYRTLKMLKTTGKGIWNQKISNASKEAKYANWIYKNKQKSSQNTENEKNDLTKKKKQLRQFQRQAYASRKDQLVKEIMESSQNDSKTFHKLIRLQRSRQSQNTDVLVIDNIKFAEDKLIDGWKLHFENLSTPQFDSTIFDLERNSLCTIQNDIIRSSNAINAQIPLATHEEVKKAIQDLNSGKAADEKGLQAEHYKNAIDELTPEMCSIINQIFKELDIPKELKTGILTPVLKKKKDKTKPGNYRGIVVTSTISKILEAVIKSRLEQQLLPTQNPLQRGFTEKTSSKNTAFITIETISIYKKLKVGLELVAVDAEKAFDTVNHEIMLNKLYHDGITGNMWKLLNNMYHGMTMKVKWENSTTDYIDIKQGIRQGAKLSTLLYKRYNNTILNSLSNSNLGARIDNIYVGSPACADDIALLGEGKEIQSMLDILESNTKRDMVKLNPSKKEIMTVSKPTNHQNTPYIIAGKEIQRVKEIKHVGITHQENGKVNIDDRLSVGRQTIYALLGAGLHARSGMSPLVLLKIWNTYVTPRCLYGLELQRLSITDLRKLEQLQRKICRQFQCLPERTSSVAVYSLIGAEPIEATMDKNTLTFLANIARLDSSVEKQILLWELEHSDDDSLFINRARKLLSKYNLPPPDAILEKPPTKSQWKKILQKAINDYWYIKILEEKSTKSTLRHLEMQLNPISKPHNIWKSVRNRKSDIQKAEIKARLATDTYMLQQHRSKFSGNKVEANCLICEDGDEDIEHFLWNCVALDDTRSIQLTKVKSAIEILKGGGTDILDNHNIRTQVMIDCTSPMVNEYVQFSIKQMEEVERATQYYCYEMHKARVKAVQQLS